MKAKSIFTGILGTILMWIMVRIFSLIDNLDVLQKTLGNLYNACCH